MNLLKIYITFFFLLCLCQIQAQTNEAFITKETSFKSEGSFSSKTISRIFADDKVILLNDCNYFYCKVDFNGRIGWVKKLLIVERNPPEKQMQTEQVDTVEQNEINFQYAADVIIPSEKKLQTDQVDSLEQDETNFQYAKEEFISKGSDTEKLNWDYENSLSVNNTSNSFLIFLYGIIILGGLLICRLGYFNYKLLFKNIPESLSIEMPEAIITYGDILDVNISSLNRESTLIFSQNSKSIPPLFLACEFRSFANGHL